MAYKIFKIFGRKPQNGWQSTDDSVEEARALIKQGQFTDAARICRELLQQQPHDFDALLLAAEVAALQRDIERASLLYAAASDVRPDHALPYYKRANLLKDQGEFAAALDNYDRAVLLDPTFANAFCNRGVVLERLIQLQEALASYQRTIELNPHDALAYFNMGGVQRKLLQPNAALASYSRAIDLSPNYVEACCNRGILLAELKQWEQALSHYDRCIEIDPNFYQAYFNRGVMLAALGRLDEALKAYDSAIAIAPNYADAYCNRAVLRAELGQREAAFVDLDRAILLKPAFAKAHSNRADLFLHANRHLEAIADYDRALSLEADPRFLLGSRLHAKMHLCDWHDFDADMATLTASIEAESKASHPFYVLGLLDSQRLQKKAAEIWVRENCPADDVLGPIAKRERRGRLKIAYFSADFRDHAIAHLIAGLIDLHDRSRIEVIGLSFGPDTQDKYRQRFEKTFDKFIDVRSYSNLQTATLARELGVDVAVDLVGHTNLNRAGIFALRAAPVQVNYLGYPGTFGGTYVDYVIADGTTVPRGSEVYFTEKVITLANSYQVNDWQRSISDRVFTRSELGLPTEGFIYCCFNNGYKILPAVFKRWMRILKAVPGSILWLLESNETAANNLRQQASAVAVDPNRLVFTKKMALPDHLARHRVADLFLDTLPYNAHTTASDALWAGLPLLTCPGESFSSRVAASLLRAIDVPELIAQTPELYEQLAVALAYDPGRLNAVRQKLAENRLVKPLFDTKLFATQLETTYTNLYERYLAGLPPAVYSDPRPLEPQGPGLGGTDTHLRGPA